MKINLEVEVEPFQTPNFVRGVKRKGEDEGVAYPLELLNAVTLEILCDQFRDEVFRKAKKNRPPQPG